MSEKKDAAEEAAQEEKAQAQDEKLAPKEDEIAEEDLEKVAGGGMEMM